MILMYYMIRFEIFAVSLVVFEVTYWRRKWEPTSMFLPGESQGQGSLVGHTESMGLHRVGHNWSDLAAAAVYIRVEVVWVDCHALFQRIFPTQGSNPGLSHCRWILYHLNHQGSPSGYIYVDATFSIHPTLSFLHSVHIFSFYMVSSFIFISFIINLKHS